MAGVVVRVQERRQRLLAAAHQALRQQDYEQIQMKEVAAAAEMALGTVYQQFSSKEHLYAAVLLQWGVLGAGGTGGGEAGRATTGPRGSGRRRPVSPQERVRAGVGDVITAYERWPYLYRLYPVLQGAADRNAQLLLAEFAAVPLRRLTSDLRLVDPAIAEDGATMLWSLLVTRLTFVLAHGGDLADVRRLSTRLLDLLLERR